MKRVVKLFVAGAFLASIVFPLAAQDDFGFGFDDDSDSFSSGGSGLSVSVTGEATISALGYFNELDSVKAVKAFDVGSLFSGSLGFAASGANADAEISIELDPSKDVPVFLGEAWARSYWGKFDIEAGVKKLTWGKVDSEGPLDVINPLDYSDLSVTDQMARKIARPLLHASYAAGSFTKVEAVFLPGFEPNRLALDGRWAPAKLSGLTAGIEDGAAQAVASALTQMVALGLLDPVGDPAGFGAAQAGLETSVTDSLTDVKKNGISQFLFKTNTLEYAQYGLRVTTTLASQDLGFQYFYGNRGEPSVSMDSANLFVPTINPLDPATSALVFNSDAVKVSYDRYHQIGVDWASVLAGFNLRSELAANITSDLKGTDGAVANSAVLWSLGFDRDLFAGINLNTQGSGSVRLMHSKLRNAPDDCEAGSDLSSTRLMARLSKTVFRDEIELSLTGMWGIEDEDFLAMPEVVWTRGETSLGARAGVFGGKKEGNLGQYHDNGYATVSFKYAF